MPKFITNSISTKTKYPTLTDIVKAAQTQASMQKSASAEEPVSKEAGRGNVANFGDKKDTGTTCVVKFPDDLRDAVEASLYAKRFDYGIRR